MISFFPDIDLVQQYLRHDKLLTHSSWARMSHFIKRYHFFLFRNSSNAWFPFARRCAQSNRNKSKFTSGLFHIGENDLFTTITTKWKPGLIKESMIDSGVFHCVSTIEKNTELPENEKH